jgi:VWFA-related protein
MVRPTTLVPIVSMAAASLLVAALESSQQQQPPPAFRSDIELIAVDVTVLDGAGDPVRGLTADDFTVTVDGKPRGVTSIEYVSHDQSGATAPTNDPAISRNRSRAPVGQVVLVLDTSGLSAPVRGPVLAAANHLLDALPPSDTVALATVPASSSSTELSTNRARVRERLESAGGWAPPPLDRQPFTATEALDCERPNGGLGDCARMIRRVCGMIRDPEQARICTADLLADTRAILIELRARADRSLDGLVALLRSLRALEGSKTVVLFSEHLLASESGIELDQIAALAAESRTRVYALRPERVAGDAAQSAIRPPGFADQHLLGAPLEIIAGRSGGQVLPLSPNPHAASEKLIRALSGYYLLGIEGQAGDRDGKPHAVNVEVRRSAVSVQARRQIVVRAPAPAATIAEQVAAAIRDPATRTALPLSLRTYRIPTSARATRVVIAADLAASSSATAVGFALVEDGVRVATSGFDEKVIGAAYLRSIVTAPGDYELTLAAVDAAGRAGSVRHPVSAALSPLGPFLAGDLIIAGAAATNEMRPPVDRRISATDVRVAVSLLTQDEEAMPGVELTIEVAPEAEAEAAKAVVVPAHRVADAANPGVFALQATMPMAGRPPGAYRIDLVARQQGREIGRIGDRFTLVDSPATGTSPVTEASRERRRDPTGPQISLGIDPLHGAPQASDTLRALGLLRTALLERGFRITDAPDLAEAHVELSGQRVFGAGTAALPRRSRDDHSVVLIRTTVSRGDVAGEVRRQNSTSNDAWKSAASETAQAIERWLAAHDTAGGRAFDLVVTPSEPLQARDIAPHLLPRMREYLDGYQKSFAAIVADERYHQAFWQRRFPYPAALHVTRRELGSEMGFTFFPEAGLWFGFRDVRMVDGAAVRDGEKGLQELLLARGLPSIDRFQQVAQASARFNIGPAVRNFNVPMITLLFASPEHQGRAQFELLRMERLNGIDLAVVAFRETASPTLVTRNGHDRPSRGLFWVEPASGRIHRTDLAINEIELEARLTTWYGYDGNTKSMVPTRMREVYDYVERVDDFVETLATYSNFRRFQTSSRIVP